MSRGFCSYRQYLLILMSSINLSFEIWQSWAMIKVCINIKQTWVKNNILTWLVSKRVTLWYDQQDKDNEVRTRVETTWSQETTCLFLLPWRLSPQASLVVGTPRHLGMQGFGISSLYTPDHSSFHVTFVPVSSSSQLNPDLLFSTYRFPSSKTLTILFHSDPVGGLDLVAWLEGVGYFGDACSQVIHLF